MDWETRTYRTEYDTELEIHTMRTTNKTWGDVEVRVIQTDTCDCYKVCVFDCHPARGHITMQLTEAHFSGLPFVSIAPIALIMAHDVQ